MATASGHLDLVLKSIQDGQSVVSEDGLDSWHNGCDIDDVADKGVNVCLEFLVAGVVVDLPIETRCVNHEEHLEDGDNLLLSLDVVLQVKQCALDRCLKTLLKFLVHLVDVVKPFLLDGSSVVEEQIFIS